MLRCRCKRALVYVYLKGCRYAVEATEGPKKDSLRFRLKTSKKKVLNGMRVIHVKWA